TTLSHIYSLSLHDALPIYDVATEIAATLAFSALKNNDKVGVIFFSDRIEHFIPPKKGKTHVLRIIRDLVNFTPVNVETNISMARSEEPRLNSSHVSISYAV